MISVTQQHIDSGLRGSCQKDPIALAMIDAGYTDVWISPDRIRANGRTYEMPKSVEQFIQKLDSLGFVDPFEFSLED
jgi:glycine cleavage system aminomethyltransferase T